jgi:hypothetical protein
LADIFDGVVANKIRWMVEISLAFFHALKILYMHKLLLYKRVARIEISKENLALQVHGPGVPIQNSGGIGGSRARAPLAQ